MMTTLKNWLDEQRPVAFHDCAKDIKTMRLALRMLEVATEALQRIRGDYAPTICWRELSSEALARLTAMIEEPLLPAKDDIGKSN
jgi:hypothetical protein